jgi:carbonic anhydrase/acetyltransferase-like protein (isoleucine patch superfamily)
MSIRSYGDKTPEIARTAYVDRDAVIIGDVTLEDDVTVWPCAILRGDDDRVVIGRGSAIMDAAFIEAPKGRPVVVEGNCLISHRATLHGCRVGEGTLVGIGAIVLDGAMLGKGSIIAAGSVVTPEAVVPPNSLALGAPARTVRDITEDEMERIREELKAVRRKAREYALAEQTARAL